MKRVMVVKHSDGSVGRMAERRDRSEVDWEEVNAAEGDRLPRVEEIGVLVKSVHWPISPSL